MPNVEQIDKAVLLKCSPKYHKAIQEHSRKTNTSMKELVDAALDDWLQCCAPAHLESYIEHSKTMKRHSQNENRA